MAFNPDIQEYLSLLNQITDQTFSTQMEEGLKYIKDHFAARGLSASGAIQDAIQGFTTKHASAATLAKTRNAALAWQLQSGRNTQRESQQWYDKQSEQGRAEDYGMQNWFAVDDAMQQHNDWFRNASRRGQSQDYGNSRYSNYPDSYFEDPRSNYYTGGGGNKPFSSVYSGMSSPGDVPTPGAVSSGTWLT